MGGKTSKKLSNQEVQRFVQQTQLQPYVIQQIYDAFIDRAGRNGRMNLAEFKQTYNQIKPNYDPYNIYGNDMEAERIFMMFDADRNGVLTFDEFINVFIQIQRGKISSYELILEEYSF
ncbi:unnamed protein product [Adineta ricciae]|uniref:EF-hand domain-containing protein n=1 Tax=Adineta ricciae TaxID=249248 RepID=A0A814J3Z6_ADIRI|nr:unnamed protein product [Adineta ricciae]